jgi:hypothetical protein
MEENWPTSLSKAIMKKGSFFDVGRARKTWPRKKSFSRR